MSTKFAEVAPRAGRGRGRGRGRRNHQEQQQKLFQEKVVASIPASAVFTQLQEFERHLKFRFTAGDVSAPKPDPEGYKKGAARLGIPKSRIVVLEDSKSGVEAAHAAGIACIQIQKDPAEISDKASLVIGSLGDKRDFDKVMKFMGIEHNLHARIHEDRRVHKIPVPGMR